MKFEKPIFVLDAEPIEDIPVTSSTETTSTYSEVWTSWLESNV